jgi:carbon-monoxide dehydrogenase large subunit
VTATITTGVIGRSILRTEDPPLLTGSGSFVDDVDRPEQVWALETRDVRVCRVVICHDVGRMVNPMLVEGQICGAAAQAAGGALLESLAYDDAGQPLTTSFMDFAMPTAVETPAVESIVLELSDRSAGPGLGVKGAGESGIVGTGAAIANAVCDALGRSLSVLPITPQQIA